MRCDFIKIKITSCKCVSVRGTQVANKGLKSMGAAYDWWKGIFLSAHAQHKLFQKCVDVSCLIMLLSLSSGLSAL